MILKFMFTILSSFAAHAAPVVFDGSPVACKPSDKTEKCEFTLIGDKDERWVGYLILQPRGSAGDVNHFVASPKEFLARIKKIPLKKVFKRNERPDTLAGFLKFEAGTWSATIEAQFADDLSVRLSKVVTLEAAHGKK